MITDEELDELGSAKVQHCFDRGDWVDKDEVRRVRYWLGKAKKQEEFLEKCQRASISSALDTKRLAILANVVALLALIVSVISLVVT